MKIVSKIFREIRRPFYKLANKIITFENRIRIKDDKLPNFGNLNIMSDEEINFDIQKYNSLNKDVHFQINNENMYICRHDKYVDNGVKPSDYYFVQDIWGARKVLESKPVVHYDVGSSIAGFVAHLLSNKQQMVLIDVRDMEDNIFNTNFINNFSDSKIIKYICTDATSMENIEDNSIQSLSALCSIEHFGLGRYGDPINPDAWRLALKSFQRVLMGGGKLYLSVPVALGDKVCFNAHRYFNPNTIVQTLDRMMLLEFSIIDDMKFETICCMKEISGNTVVDNNKLKDILSKNRIDGSPAGLFEFIKI